MTCVTVDVRVIIRQALGYNATGIILAHNHPSGNTKPSDNDVKLTEKITKAADFFDIRVVDHVILSSDPRNFFSFVDKGLL